MNVIKQFGLKMAGKIQNGHQNAINCYFLASNWHRNTNFCSISWF